MAKRTQTTTKKTDNHSVKRPTPVNPSAVGANDAISSTQGATFADGRFHTAQRQAIAAQIGERGGNQHLQRVIQRVVEVRPPGRGEASAFERRQELIDRMNALSSAVTYSLDGRVLQYEVQDETALNNFDQQMIAFIDQEQVVPMRLINHEGRVGGESVFVDTLEAGYVDLDDMLASDDLSFQMNLIHLLRERFQVRNYERRIGTNMDADFPAAHRAGLDAEAQHLQTVVGDPTIRFLYEETRPNGTVVFGFRSSEGYRIFHVFRGARRQIRGGFLFAQSRDGRRLSIDELRAERQAAAQAAAPAAEAAPVP